MDRTTDHRSPTGAPTAGLPDGLRRLTTYSSMLPGHRGTGRRHPSALVRLVTRGTPLPDGTRLRLRAIRWGSSWMTTDEWVGEYVDRLTSAHLGGDGPVRSPAARTRASEEAAAELKRMGI